MIENNINIAKFLGWKYERQWHPKGATYIPYGWTVPIDDPLYNKAHSNDNEALLFHTSWDWLMPVVEKIRNFKVFDGERLAIMSSIHVHIDSTGYEWHCSILGSITVCHTEKVPHTYTKIQMPHISVKGTNRHTPPIEPVYAAVLQFIQWFNTQKQSV